MFNTFETTTSSRVKYSNAFKNIDDYELFRLVVERIWYKSDTKFKPL